MKKNINKNNIIISIIILFLLLIFVLIIVLLYLKINNYILDPIKKAYDTEPAKGNGKNLNMCQPGCVRGICNKLKDINSCKYDFQCNMCQDRITNMFYINSNKEKYIQPNYEESKNLNYTQTKLLDKKIDENNIYIKDLNNLIKKLNS